MKEQLWRWVLLALFCLIVEVAGLSGCNDNPPASISNTQVNEITEHEMLVNEFASTEVASIPSNSHEFMVRDTNGVVWYVSCRSSALGRTRIFGWHEEFPRPVAPPTVTITNFVSVTNIVTVTNTIVEDPLKK